MNGFFRLHGNKVVIFSLYLVQHVISSNTNLPIVVGSHSNKVRYQLQWMHVTTRMDDMNNVTSNTTDGQVGIECVDQNG